MDILDNQFVIDGCDGIMKIFLFLLILMMSPFPFILIGWIINKIFKKKVKK